MTNLREARKKGRLDKFVAEHEADPPGDIDKLDAAIGRPAQEKSKSDQEASTPGSDDG